MSDAAMSDAAHESEERPKQPNGSTDVVARVIATVLFLLFLWTLLTGTTGENEGLMDWFSNGRW